MTRHALGLATHHTRVERWECDYNDHWNVRFYGRSFQHALEAVAVHGGQPNPGTSALVSRHMRFHRELRVSAPVAVHSAVLTGAGVLDGAIVHHLLSTEGISATALDIARVDCGHLPRVTPDGVALALPRGITSAPAPDHPEDGAMVLPLVFGSIRPEDLDHKGTLRFERLLSHSAIAQHAHLNGLGFTPEYAARHRINRMAVEFRITLGSSPPAGTVLRGDIWISKVESKAFWGTCRIVTTEGTPCATIEKCVLAVNLDTRKAVPVPDFIRESLQG